MNQTTKHLVRNAASSLALLALSSLAAQAQVFNPSFSSEVTYPTTNIGPLAPAFAPATFYTGFPIDYAQVPGLFCNAHAAAGGVVPGDPPGPSGDIAETASWTVSDASGWENGYFTYGYTNAAGTYVPVGTESIPGAKHLSAVYMTDPSGANAYILAAYTVRHERFNEVSPCVYMPYSPRAYGYAQEYRIYSWPVLTAPVSFARMGRVSNIFAGISTASNYPSCHPLYSSPYRLWGPDFSYDGNIVVDVSVDAKRIAFAWTGNGGSTMLAVANINATTNPPTLNISTSPAIAASAARDPLDVAFRRDPTLGSGGDSYTDFIHTLINDGTNRYYVAQNDYHSIAGTGGFTQLLDDASYITTPPYGTMWTGTPLYTGRADQIKLDVPDVSNQRKWAYTWSDGNNIHLRRYQAASSLSPGSAIGSSATQTINNGTLLDMMGNTIDLCNTNQNIKAAIAYKASTDNIYLSWLTDATVYAPGGASGFENAVSIELGASIPWTAPRRAVSTQDYLHVQTNTAVSAREYVALSHHSNTTANLLYNCFTADDGIDNYLNHKNHDMTVSSMWRSTAQAAMTSSSNISVNPNPFSNTLQLQGTGSLQLQLNDITGRHIASYSGTAEVVNPELSATAGRLAAGTYILSVKNEQGQDQVFKLNKL